MKKFLMLTILATGLATAADAGSFSGAQRDRQAREAAANAICGCHHPENNLGWGIGWRAVMRAALWGVNERNNWAFDYAVVTGARGSAARTRYGNPYRSPSTGQYEGPGRTGQRTNARQDPYSDSHN